MGTGRRTQKKFVAEIRAQCRREPSESEASGSRSRRQPARQPARLLNEQSPARVSRGRRMSVDGRDAKTRLAVYKNAKQVACHLTNGNSEVYCSHPMCETRLWLHEEDIPIGISSSCRNQVMDTAHIVAAVRGGDATGPGDCIPLCRKHNSGRRENQLLCIERECEAAKVRWSLNRLYMAIKEGVNKDLLP